MPGQSAGFDSIKTERTLARHIGCDYARAKTAGCCRCRSWPPAFTTAESSSAISAPTRRFPRIAPRASSSGSARSEEHTSERQSLMRISYAVFCLKKKNNKTRRNTMVTDTYNQDIKKAVERVLRKRPERHARNK